MGKSYDRIESTSAGNGGFIVSHERFDGGIEFDNYYKREIRSYLTLTALSVNDVLRLSFVTLNRRRSTNEACDYQLEISSVRGYRGNKLNLCDFNYRDQVIDFQPESNQITFRFSNQPRRQSKGFLLKYTGKSFTLCFRLASSDASTFVSTIEYFLIASLPLP